jgi:cytochrome c oxidase subunit 2
MQTTKRKIQGLAAAFIGCVLLALPQNAFAAIQPETNWYSMPRDVSTEGYRIDWLIDITTVFCTILFAIMCYIMAKAYISHSKDKTAHYDHGDGRGQMLFACTVSAIVFLWVDGNLFYFSMRDLDEVFWNYEGYNAEEDVVRIEINGHQWAWDARYAGPDGEFNTGDDVLTLNDIRIPVGAPIYFQLASTDVIHSFYLPNLRTKQDAVPGYINHLLTEASETGEFDIACAQHCGAHHYLMKAVLTIMEPEDFDAWASEASRRSQLAFDADNSELNWGWSWKEI